MKKATIVLSLMSVFSLQSANAVILTPNPPHADPHSTSSKNPPADLAPDTLVPSVPRVTPVSPNSSSSTIQLPKELSQMNPEERDALLKQARTMNNEQLQAVAKSFHQQLNPQDKTISTGSPKPAPNSPAAMDARKAEKQRSIEELKREQAFNSLMEEVMPMSPEQIIKMHKYYDLTLQAKATPPSAPASPIITSRQVDLSPGSDTPVIRLAAGFVTTVIFLDNTGQPLKITAYSVGDPQNFNIQWNQKDNVLFIQSLKVYAHANMAVRLYAEENIPPVILTLVSGQKNVDYRVDLTVPIRGPDAKAVVIDTAFSAKVNPLLMNLLDGIPPKGSIKLNVIGGLGDAWLYDNKVYFRSKLTILSPAWLSSVSSPDGTHVYEMMLTPYIVATQNGRTVDIKLSGL